LRVNPATGKQSAKLDLPGAPVWDKGGEDLIAAFGSVWMAGDSAQGMKLIRIDPSTNQVSVTALLGGGLALNVTSADSSIWVLTTKQRRCSQEGLACGCCGGQALYLSIR